MKKKIKLANIILLIMIFISLQGRVMAQKNVTEGIITINNVTYLVSTLKKSDYIKKERYSIERYGESRKKPIKPKNPSAEGHAIYPTIENLDEWKEMVKDILGPAKLNILKENNEFIRVLFGATPEGDVRHIDFTLANPTILTMKEIVQIENFFLNKYKIKMSSKNNIHLRYSYFILSDELNF